LEVLVGVSVWLRCFDGVWCGVFVLARRCVFWGVVTAVEREDTCCY
jgi:hypothetical protein